MARARLNACSQQLGGRVDDLRVAHPHLLQERTRNSGRILGADPEECDLPAEVVVSSLQHRHLRSAGPAPGCPQVHHHRPAPKVAQPHLLL